MKAEIGVGLAAFAYAALLFGLSFQYPWEARVFPLVVGGAGMLIGVAHLLNIMRGSHATTAGTATTAAPPPLDRGRLWQFLVGTVGSVALVYVAGIYAYAFLFPLVFGRVYSHLPWRSALVMGVSLGAFTYVMFDVVLNAPLNQVGLVYQLLGVR